MDADAKRVEAEDAAQIEYEHRHRECGPDCVVTGDECPPLLAEKVDG